MALALTGKQILTIAGGVVVLAAAGWFGWQYYEEAKAPPPPPPAAAKPPPKPVAPSPDKLIAELLAASGLNQQLNQLPQQLIDGVRQSSKLQSKTPPVILAAIEKAVTESFTAENFRDRVNTDLKANFDLKRAQALLGELAKPAAKRMIGLEQVSPSQQVLAEFARSAAAKQMSPERKDLIKRVDAATRASDLAVEAAFASMKAVAIGIVGAQPKKAAAVEKTIEQQRASTTANIRNATFNNLAFAYMDASDAELEGYAKFYEGENSKWFSGIVYASMLEEVRSAAKLAGERVGALTSKPKDAKTAPDKTPVAADKPAPRAHSHRNADARDCLKQEESPAIMVCAEKFR
jgi:hypothetical protein